MAICLLPVNLLKELHGVNAEKLGSQEIARVAIETGACLFAPLCFCDYCLLCPLAGAAGPGSLSAGGIIE